jgi:surface carbohydrate biosynthesis protein (TIGR04326 family)
MSVIASNIMFTKMFNGFKSKRLVYLQENQAWQVSMLQAWNNTEKDYPRTSIGFPHATISFWDLRYHFHRDILEDDYEYKRYLPDLIAISGKLNKNCLQRSHVPSKRLVEVEALRYLYLQKSGVDSFNIGAVDVRNEALNANKDKDPKINLLILTDYSQQRSISLLEMISKLPSKIVNKYNIRVRCHPASPIPNKSKLRKQFEFSDLTLVDLVSWSSIVITTSTTSSSVDALCNNKKVLIFVSPGFVNPSPLYPSTSITWVHGLTELKHVLDSTEFSISDMGNAKDYFFLDSTLPRWSRLLKLDC